MQLVDQDFILPCIGYISKKVTTSPNWGQYSNKEVLRGVRFITNNSDIVRHFVMYKHVPNHLHNIIESDLEWRCSAK